MLTSFDRGKQARVAANKKAKEQALSLTLLSTLGEKVGVAFLYIYRQILEEISLYFKINSNAKIIVFSRYALPAYRQAGALRYSVFRVHFNSKKCIISS
jgi:hypothetical protein